MLFRSDGFGPGVGFQVIGEGLGLEELLGRDAAGGVVAEPQGGGGVDEVFREGVRLGEPEPMVVAQTELHVRALEMLDGGNDVEDGEFLHHVREVYGEAVGDAGAAVVAGEVEAAMAEMELQIEEKLVEVERIKKNILIQEARVTELKQFLNSNI